MKLVDPSGTQANMPNEEERQENLNQSYTESALNLSAEPKEDSDSKKVIQKKTISDDMKKLIRASSFNPNDTNAQKMCAVYSQQGAINAAKLYDPKAELLPKEQAIAVAKYYGKENIAKHSQGDKTYSQQYDIMVDTESAKNALDYIQTSIDRNLPVVAGVNVSGNTSTGNLGEITDHFVVIVGYESVDEDITKLSGIDPAMPGGWPTVFSVDSETGKATKAIDPLVKKGLTANKTYQIDQVRLWKGLKPNSSVGLGANVSSSERRR